MTALPPAEDAPHGVSLARYAAVVAAVAEPFPLGRVLALEGIEPRAFRAAEVAWKRRVVAQAARRGSLFVRYTADLAAAEDWLIRRVSPLYQEPQAWAAFLCAFRAKPAEVLRSTGLGRNDFSRLSRHWARLAAEDAGLGRWVARELESGPRDLPRVTAEPRELRRSRGCQQSACGAPAVRAPSAPPPASPALSTPPPALTLPSPPPPLPASPRRAPPQTIELAAFPTGPALPFAPRRAPRTETAAMPAFDGAASRPALPFIGAAEAPPSRLPELPLSVSRYASLRVELLACPDGAAATERRYGLTGEARAALDAQYGERFARDPALHRAFLEACATYRAWLASGGR